MYQTNLQGDIGSPIQFDSIHKNWFIHVPTNNDIYTELASLGVNGLTDKSNVTTISRTVDPRSLDERIYTVRVVVPKEATNAKDPNDGFVIQESSTTGVRASTDFTQELLMQLMYSLIVIQDLSALVLHQVAQSPSELNYHTT